MNTWSFYDPASGRLLDLTVSCTDDQLAANTPVGYVAIAGYYDALSQKVDILADPPAVIDYVPDAPADTDLETWAWDASTKRWVATPTLLANKDALAVVVQAQIDTMEAGDSHQRSLREIVLALQAATTPPSDAVTELTAIDDAITELRATLDEIDAAATQGDLDAIVMP